MTAITSNKTTTMITVARNPIVILSNSVSGSLFFIIKNLATAKSAERRLPGSLHVHFVIGGDAWNGVA